MKKQSQKKNGGAGRQVRADRSRTGGKRVKRQPAKKIAAQLEDASSPGAPILAPETAASVAFPASRRPFWQRAMWPGLLAAGVTIICLAMFWWLVSNFSFSRLTLGGVALPRGISDAQLAQRITASAASYRLRLLYPDGRRVAFS